MLNKKAWAYPIELVVGVALLLLILTFYSIIFFGVDATKSDAPVVSAEGYKDSVYLINILKTNIEVHTEKLSIADAINDIYSGRLKKEEIEYQIQKVLESLPRPDNSEYALEIKGSQNLDFGKSINIQKFLEQKTTIPLSNKENAIATIYLTCERCEEVVKNYE